jgi:hypothetical protein
MTSLLIGVVAGFAATFAFTEWVNYCVSAATTGVQGGASYTPTGVCAIESPIGFIGPLIGGPLAGLLMGGGMGLLGGVAGTVAYGLLGSKLPQTAPLSL